MRLIPLAICVILFDPTAQTVPVSRGAASEPRTTAPRQAQDERARADRRTKLLSEANELAFALRGSPRRADAPELRLREARLRILAALLDDEKSAAPAPALALAEAVKLDRQQPTSARIEVARLVSMAERKNVKFADREAWLDARERAARRLLKEFPTEPAGLDELLALADVSGPTRALRLAREIGASPSSATIKARAQDIAWRHTATDRPIVDVLADVPGATPLLAQVKGKRTIFYTWSPDDERSIELALALAAVTSPETFVVGINMSPRVAEALARVNRAHLPGVQLYGARGFDSPVVRRLGLTRPAQLYAVGSDGTVHDLSAVSDRAAMLAKIN